MRYVITALGNGIEFTREITAHTSDTHAIDALVAYLAGMGACVTVETFPLYV